MPTDDDRSWMAAVTFAEAGEWSTALRYAPLPRRGRLHDWLERHLVAAALAEEGLHDAALGLVSPEASPGNEGALDELLAVHGIRMFCGVLSPAVLGPRR